MARNLQNVRTMADWLADGGAWFGTRSPEGFQWRRTRRGAPSAAVERGHAVAAATPGLPISPFGTRSCRPARRAGDGTDARPRVRLVLKTSPKIRWVGWRSSQPSSSADWHTPARRWPARQVTVLTGTAINSRGRRAGRHRWRAARNHPFEVDLSPGGHSLQLPTAAGTDPPLTIEREPSSTSMSTWRPLARPPHPPSWAGWTSAPSRPALKSASTANREA